MIHSVCRDIMANLGVTRFVETGTYLGGTMVEVAKWVQAIDPDFGKIDYYAPDKYLSAFPSHAISGEKILYPVFKGSKDSKIKLFSIDIDKEKQNALSIAFKTNPNIRFISDSSEKHIKELLDRGSVSDEHRSLFYLDAHWGEYWPLRDEISHILRLKRSIIAIDDFVVPFHPGYGFYVFGTKVCGWYYIKDLFNGSGKRYMVYYPKRPNADKMGTVIIFVGYSDDELEFMRELPVFSPRFFKGAVFTELIFGKSRGVVKNVLVCMGLYPLVRRLMERRWIV